MVSLGCGAEFGAPAQYGAHAGDQLTRVERLAEIIVGADLESDDAVDIFFQRGEQDDRHAGALGAKVAAKIEPRAVRQHHVEHDQVDLVRGKLLAQLAAVCREQHAETLALDIAGEQLADFRIVVDDENALGDCGHGPGKWVHLGKPVLAARAQPSSAFL